MGLDGELDQLDFRRYMTGSGTPEAASRAEVVQHSGALYGLSRWSIDPCWSVEAGVRGETHRLAARQWVPPLVGAPELWPLAFDERSTDINYAAQLGVNARLAASWHVWARGDRVYRYPSTDEVATYQGYELTVPFNRDLKAETGWAVESGLGWAHAGWTADASVFALWLHDEIAFDAEANVNTNLPPTRRLGAEVSLGHSWEAVSLRSALTFVDARLIAGADAGHELPLVAPWVASVGGDWRLARQWTLRGDVSYQSARVLGDDYANRRPQLDGYTLCNLGLSWEPRPWLRVQAQADNVFDRTTISTGYRGSYYPGDGRSLRLSATYRF